MKFERARRQRTHGSGRFRRKDFKAIGKNVVIENGVLVFHAENIVLGDNVYIGHLAILKGYYRNQLVVGSNTWIGQGCFLHSAGGIEIGESVGIGPYVKVVTSMHEIDESTEAILHSELRFAKVTIEHGCDIGAGAIVLPGVTIGHCSQIGAGAVVTRDVEPYAVAVGNPAKEIRRRCVKP